MLKPEGRFLFVEHGRAPAGRVRVWQDRLNPLWKRVAGGCHMNRPIEDLIAQAGFRFTRIEKEYTSGPKVLTYFYRGVAEPAA